MSRSKLVVKGEKYDSSDRVRADRTDLLYSHIPEGETLVSIKDLNVTYRTDEKTTVAVDDLSFDIKKGELVSIVGPSGCGKSTILRCISGLLQPTSGEILIGGNKYKVASAAAGAAGSASLIFQPCVAPQTTKTKPTMNATSARARRGVSSTSSTGVSGRASSAPYIKLAVGSLRILRA